MDILRPYGEWDTNGLDRYPGGENQEEDSEQLSFAGCCLVLSFLRRDGSSLFCLDDPCFSKVDEAVESGRAGSVPGAGRTSSVFIPVKMKWEICAGHLRNCGSI